MGTNPMTNDLEAIRQRDAKGYSESGTQWSSRRVEDSEAQAKSDRHALLAYIDSLAHEPTREPTHPQWEDTAGALRELAPSAAVPAGLRPLMLQAAEQIALARRCIELHDELGGGFYDIDEWCNAENALRNALNRGAEP
jgi:hypothetical protein